MNRKHILVVDDDLNMLRSMEFILEAADFDVSTARNGREGLEKIMVARDRHQTIDLLITDIQMPVLTGVQLIDELHRMNLSLPVLAVTAYGDQKLKNELARRGCAYFLDKPFDDERFIRNVSTILENKSPDPNLAKEKRS